MNISTCRRDSDFLETRIDMNNMAQELCGHFDIPVVCLAHHAGVAALEPAKSSQAFGHILKPFQERELLFGGEMALYKHQTQCRLKQGEERFRTLAETVNEHVVVIDEDGIILFMTT